MAYQEACLFLDKFIDETNNSTCSASENMNGSSVQLLTKKTLEVEDSDFDDDIVNEMPPCKKAKSAKESKR